MKNFLLFDATSAITLLFFKNEEFLKAEPLWNNPEFEAKGVIYPHSKNCLDLKELYQHLPEATQIKFLINKNNNNRVQLSVSRASIHKKNQKKVFDKNCSEKHSCNFDFTSGYGKYEPFQSFIPFVINKTYKWQFLDNAECFSLDANIDGCGHIGGRALLGSQLNSPALELSKHNADEYIKLLESGQDTESIMADKLPSNEEFKRMKAEEYLNSKYCGEDMTKFYFKVLKTDNSYKTPESSINDITLLFFKDSEFLGKHSVSESKMNNNYCIFHNYAISKYYENGETIHVVYMEKLRQEQDYPDFNRIKLCISNDENCVVHTDIIELIHGVSTMRDSKQEPFEDGNFFYKEFDITGKPKLNRFKASIPFEVYLNEQNDWLPITPEENENYDWIKTDVDEYIENIQKQDSSSTINDFKLYHLKNKELQNKQIQLMKLELKKELIGNLSEYELHQQLTLKSDVENLTIQVDNMVNVIDDALLLIYENDMTQEVAEIKETVSDLQFAVNELSCEVNSMSEH